MIVAIGLIGVFLSGFLLGAVLRRQPQTFTEEERDCELRYPIPPVGSAYVSNPEATIVTGDVPPTWTEDALR